MSEIKISEMIRVLRGNKGISQETLADVCGVSMQAVSKWENGQSCPDITFLPLLAEYFGVSIDYLLTGRRYESEDRDSKLIDQLEKETEKDILYIIQYRNGKILDKKQWNKECLESKSDAVRIRFEEELQRIKPELHVKVWGNAYIEAPDTDLNLSAGENVNCGTVQGDIKAGASVKCLDVSGQISAGCDVTCSNIEGEVKAGKSVNCSNIQGDVKAGCNVSCDTINGDVTAGCSISCEKLEGDANHYAKKWKQRF